MAQLDGSDIVYVARVSVPKIITFAVSIGTRFPALQTSLGKVLLAAGDTFRAAAIEQLAIWGERTGCTVVSRPTGADAAGPQFVGQQDGRRFAHPDEPWLPLQILEGNYQDAMRQRLLRGGGGDGRGKHCRGRTQKRCETRHAKSSRRQPEHRFHAVKMLPTLWQTRGSRCCFARRGKARVNAPAAAPAPRGRSR